MTEIRRTSQQSGRTAGPLNMVILHHAAATSAEQVVSMMVSGSREVSAHAVVKDGRRIGVVDESDRAWSLSSAYWDSRAFTVECANESTDGWTISDASHESLAQLTADWARRYGFPIIRSGPRTSWTLLGHREVYEIYGDSYATACPGGMDLDRIAARANQILSGAEPVKPPKRTDTRVMNSYQFSDRSGRSVAPGKSLRLQKGGKDQNVVGAKGKDYSITPHLVAEGAQPGDSLELVLVWSNKGKPSFHYPVVGVADASGRIAISPEFKRAVDAGDSVFVQVSAPASNKGPVKVTVLDCDAYLFSR
jgi:hypothetical protein